MQRDRHRRSLPKVTRCLDRIDLPDYIFFGTVTAVIEAAPGVGIVSAFILQSDCLDEIDWEWVGGTTTNVQSNFFYRGIADYSHGGVHNVANPQTTFHSIVS